MNIAYKKIRRKKIPKREIKNNISLIRLKSQLIMSQLLCTFIIGIINRFPKRKHGTKGRGLGVVTLW